MLVSALLTLPCRGTGTPSLLSLRECDSSPVDVVSLLARSYLQKQAGSNHERHTIQRHQHEVDYNRVPLLDYDLYDGKASFWFRANQQFNYTCAVNVGTHNNSVTTHRTNLQHGFQLLGIIPTGKIDDSAPNEIDEPIRGDFQKLKGA